MVWFFLFLGQRSGQNRHDFDIKDAKPACCSQQTYLNFNNSRLNKGAVGLL
jgi:hypothetical protein